MKKIAYTRPDGGISIVVPAQKADIEKFLGPLTDEQYMAHVKERSIPHDALNVIEIDDAIIPNSREFRDAWKCVGNTIQHDLDKARDIQLNRMRFVREEKFKALDKEFMLALEKDDKDRLQEISLLKQKLRDITQPLKTMQLNNIEDVRIAYPAELKE